MCKGLQRVLVRIIFNNAYQRKSVVPLVPFTVKQKAFELIVSVYLTCFGVCSKKQILSSKSKQTLVIKLCYVKSNYLSLAA